MPEITSDTIVLAIATLASGLLGALIGGWIASRATRRASERAVAASEDERRELHRMQRRLALQALSLEIRMNSRLVELESSGVEAETTTAFVQTIPTPPVVYELRSCRESLCRCGCCN